MKSKWTTCQELELVPTRAPTFEGEKPNLDSWFGNVWKLLVKTLPQLNEPKVLRMKRNTEEVRWNAYDPITGRKASLIVTAQKAFLISEEEIRIWLDQRYY